MKILSRSTESRAIDVALCLVFGPNNTSDLENREWNVNGTPMGRYIVGPKASKVDGV